MIEVSERSVFNKFVFHVLIENREHHATVCRHGVMVVIPVTAVTFVIETLTELIYPQKRLT